MNTQCKEVIVQYVRKIDKNIYENTPIIINYEIIHVKTILKDKESKTVLHNKMFQK